MTRIPAHVTLIDKYIRKTAAAELGELSEVAKNKLARLGYSTTRRRRHDKTRSDSHVSDEDSDEEGRRTRKTRRR